MGLLQGVLISGAAATGVVVAERIRHRGSGEDVREDIEDFGSNIAHHAGRAAGFVGHASSRMLGESAKFAEGVGDRTTKFVDSAGHTVSRGAGAAMGAYAGAIDRVMPSFGDDEPAPKKTTAKKTTAKKTTKQQRQPARAKAS